MELLEGDEVGFVPSSQIISAFIPEFGSFKKCSPAPEKSWNGVQEENGKAPWLRPSHGKKQLESLSFVVKK